MSFLSGAAKNNFQPASAYAPGTQAVAQNLQPAINTANNEYGLSTRGLGTLAGALQQQMSGQGPNLANQQLQNATGQNVATQAALMAGQRGAGANAGLMARQAAQQGAGIQQQAAGQSAQNVLAQQLAAQQQLAGVYGQQGQLANQNLGIQQNAMASQNSDILKNQQGMNTINADTAKQNTQANQGMLGGIGGVIGQLAPMALGAMTGGIAPLAMGAMGQMAGGAGDAGGIGGMLGSALAADGGPANQLPVQGQPIPQVPNALQNFVNGVRSPQTQQFAGGGSVLPFTPMNFVGGGTVQAQAPQQKAVAKGNDYSNDKIPAMLSEGEFVINREIMQSPNAPQLAADAIRKALSKGKK